jgi:hypothetical protein
LKSSRCSCSLCSSQEAVDPVEGVASSGRPERGRPEAHAKKRMGPGKPGSRSFKTEQWYSDAVLAQLSHREMSTGALRCRRAD